MSTIKSIHAREILDSRGIPTVEADIILNNGELGRACVPSGASTGSREAVELRDQDLNRYQGKGVLKAVDTINTEINRLLVGQVVSHQREIDQRLIDLDGTANKNRLGANAILAVSLAVAKAAAASEKVSLYQHFNNGQNMSMPVPMMNIINGGAHANNNLDIQEFMIVPVGADSFANALRCGVEIFYTLKKELSMRNLSTAVGDEGGFAPNLKKNTDAIELILTAIEKSAYQAGKDVYIALDIASSEFYKNGYYFLDSEKKELNSREFIAYMENWVNQYPIISLEDGMAENDWDGWKLLTDALGESVQLVGDDLFVTNPQYLQKGISAKIANAILIKCNQIGTVSETLNAINLAQSANYNTIISHRSGETEDTTISDLAVATGANQIKTGSLCRSERVAKYNQLLRIEEATKGRIKFAGKEAFIQWKV